MGEVVSEQTENAGIPPSSDELSLGPCYPLVFARARFCSSSLSVTEEKKELRGYVRAKITGIPIPLKDFSLYPFTRDVARKATPPMAPAPILERCSLGHGITQLRTAYDSRIRPQEMRGHSPRDSFEVNRPWVPHVE